MHFKSLKIFCDVVSRRSFSRAADDNGISQSGASQVVHQLEERLGVKLIDRSKRPFVLTAEGETYYEGCRRIVQQYFRLEERITAVHEEAAGRVVVASIYSVGLYLMSRYVQDFLTSHPRANVKLEYLHPRRVYEAVENDEADLGLVSYPRTSRTLEAIAWREEPMVLACSPHHPLAAAKSIELNALHGQTMVCFESGLWIRRAIDKALAKRHVEVQVAMEFDNIETIKRAIEIDAGIGLLPEPTVAREVTAGTLVKIPLSGAPLIRPLGIIRRRSRPLSGTVLQFQELLLAQGAAIAAPPAGDDSEEFEVAGGPQRMKAK